MAWSLSLLPPLSGEKVGDSPDEGPFKLRCRRSPLTLTRSPQKGEGTTNYTTLPDNAIFNDWLLINVHRRQLIRNHT